MNKMRNSGSQIARYGSLATLNNDSRQNSIFLSPEKKMRPSLGITVNSQ
jgi:hypothetical protein